jgi:hypothetical protein
VAEDFDPEEAPEAGREPYPGAPLWVKVFAGIALALVVLFVVLLLIGRGHGPGRHGAFDNDAGVTDAQLRR